MMPSSDNSVSASMNSVVTESNATTGGVALILNWFSQFKLLLLAISLIFFNLSTVQAKSFVFGVEDVNLYPFYDFTSSKPRGYLVEMIEKFAAEQGMEVEFRVLPPRELWKAYLNHEVDFRMPDNLLWKRSKKVEHRLTYSAPLVYFNSGVVSLTKNKNLPISRLGTIQGFTAWSYKEKIESGEIQLVEESGTGGLIEGLFNGRTDGVYYNVEAYIRQVQDAGYPVDSVVFRRELIKSHSLYMMSSINHGDKVLALNQFLRDNRKWVRDRKNFYGIK